MNTTVNTPLPNEVVREGQGGGSPRGIRNNNPLNIRIGSTWVGEVERNTDGVFEQYVSMELGIRAAFKLIKTYIHKYRRYSIRRIIQSWAPSNENNTQLYIDKVASISGINPDEIVCFEDKKTMISIVNAMIFVENGRYVPLSTIEMGYLLARST